jgi:hypothetical protein
MRECKANEYNSNHISLNVARLANLPKPVLDLAHKKASEMEAAHEHNDEVLIQHRTRRLLSAIFGRKYSEDNVKKDVSFLSRRSVVHMSTDT